ncbi:uncharacterized protein LOC117114553 [Anneissia japonica]|uniref:uncharacterized protein LOC117114553 n=1 Tax=Anneissia japonica TaxID=1529436 RepID=UPI00142553FD|nr:uncharacterized protein LOC117114553 [Anneissia japonica]
MWLYAITLLVQSCAVGFTVINLIDFVTKSAGLTLEQGTVVLGVNGGAELFAKLLLSMFLDKLSFPKILLWPFNSIVAAVICILITYVSSFEVIMVLSIGLLLFLFDFVFVNGIISKLAEIGRWSKGMNVYYSTSTFNAEEVIAILEGIYGCRKTRLVTKIILDLLKIKQ